MNNEPNNLRRRASPSVAKSVTWCRPQLRDNSVSVDYKKKKRNDPAVTEGSSSEETQALMMSTTDFGKFKELTTKDSSRCLKVRLKQSPKNSRPLEVLSKKRPNVLSNLNLRLKCVSCNSVFLTGCFVSNLHTGECIHGCYFIAGASIHTVGDIHPFAKFSMICSKKVTFQVRIKRCRNDKCLS